MNSAVKIWRQSEQRYRNLGKIGKVVSWTRIIEAPKRFRPPYIVVMVELAEDKRVVGELVDEEIRCGDRVKAVLRRLGEVKAEEIIEYGTKWRKI